MPNDYTHKDWIKSIQCTKEYLLDDLESDDADKSLKTYHPYLINNQLSKKMLNILLVNEMNINSHLDKKLQYDFLFHSVEQADPNALKEIKGKSAPKEKFKPAQLDAVKKHFGYSNEKARSAIRVMTKDQIHQIVYFVNESKGGKK